MNEKQNGRDSNHKLMSINVLHKILWPNQRSQSENYKSNSSHFAHILPFHHHSSSPNIFLLPEKKGEQTEKGK